MKPITSEAALAASLPTPIVVSSRSVKSDLKTSRRSASARQHEAFLELLHLEPARQHFGVVLRRLQAFIHPRQPLRPHLVKPDPVARRQRLQERQQHARLLRQVLDVGDGLLGQHGGDLLVRHSLFWLMIIFALRAAILMSQRKNTRTTPSANVKSYHYNPNLPLAAKMVQLRW